EVLGQLNGEFPMDEAVIEEVLPKNSTFVSVESYGSSAWTTTGRVTARDVDGTQKAYFLKVAYGEHGRIMLNGEWESSKAIHELMPGFVPEPLGFGRYKLKKPATWFYLCEFIDMDLETAPDPVDFTAKVSELHKTSRSPTGKFGFHVTTCDGKIPHVVTWEENWANFFARLLTCVCKLDLETNGPWPEFERATAQIVTKVVPRLLGDLQTEGRQIKPCLIHGDLYEGNVGINIEMGDSILYDVGSYYAHNEMDLGQWRLEFSSVFRSKLYTHHYLQNYAAAEPTDEFDDRNRLYSLEGTINYSAGHPGSSLRKTAYNNMCYLCEKFAPINGIDTYDAKSDPSITGARIKMHEGLI
ncbi:MAG: hypothetical protein Q9157_006158, partial [Trypethelium eluteriae]